MNKDIDIEHHLMKALYELDLVREDYFYRKNKRKSDHIDRIIKSVIKEHPNLKERWIEEKEKWVL